MGPYWPALAAAIFAAGIFWLCGTPSEASSPPGLNEVGFLPLDLMTVRTACGRRCLALPCQSPPAALSPGTAGLIGGGLMGSASSRTCWLSVSVEVCGGVSMIRARPARSEPSSS
jgi:hypothetical protein